MSSLLWPVTFLLLALGLIVLEMLIPSGGLLGIVAALCLIAGMVTAFINVGAAGGAAYLLACSIVLPMVVALMIRLWPNTPMGRRILIQPRADDELLPHRQQSLKGMIGRTGIAISSMLPSGAMRVDGQLMDAVSEGMSIDKGTPVEIVDVRGNHVVVRPTKQPIETGIVAPLADPTFDTVIPDPFEDPLT